MALFLSCSFYDPWTFVWLRHAPCGTSVPSQQWNPGPPAVEVWTRTTGPPGKSHDPWNSIMTSVGWYFQSWERPIDTVMGLSSDL